MLKKILTRGFGLVVTGVAIFMCNMSLRSFYLRFLRFFGEIGLKLFPAIYTHLDAQNAANTSGHRIKESYQDKEMLTRYLREAEEKHLSKEELLSSLGNSVNISTVLNVELAQVFEAADSNIEVAVQYSGGCDSTLVAMLAAKYFKRVHLLNFTHRFISDPGKSDLNANKIISMFGENKVVYRRIDTSDIFNNLLFGDYINDVKTYHSFVVGIGCLACKFSFDIGAIEYAIENNIKCVLDGADLSVKTQLSQGDEAILAERARLYSEYGIAFKHPAAQFNNNAIEMLMLGLDSDPNTIMYAEQPVCIGNQFLNEIYDRYYYLPKYGIDLHSKRGLEWLKDKNKYCKATIEKKSIE